MMDTRAESHAIVNVTGAGTDDDLIRLFLETRRAELTRRGYGRELAWWRARVGPLHRLTLGEVHAVLEQAPNERPATRARRIGALRSLLSYGHRTGYLTINLGAVLDVPRVPNGLAERILEPDQVHALLAAAAAAPRTGKRDHAIVRVLYVSACRVAELAALEWIHVHGRDDGAASLTIFGKGGIVRHVYVTPATARELEELAPAERQGPVFRTRGGGRLEVRDMERLVRRAVKRAGLPPATPHWLRHSHATHALERGAPVHVVAATLGHASVATTTRYLHARPGSGSAEYLGL